MRILWLTPYLPAPTFGAGTRVFNLIKEMASTCDIDLIAIDENRDEMALNDLRRLCRTVEVMPRPTSSRGWKRVLQIRSLISVRSAQYWMLRSRKVQALITQTMQNVSYDVVILEHSFTGCYTLPHKTLLVLDQHNVESEILHRASRRERSILRRAYNLLEYWKYRLEEKRICCKADLILATSDIDREIMRGWRNLPACFVVPNGVNSDYFLPAEHRTDDSKAARVVFTGSMHYSPNTEAMLYFMSAIWPRIQAAVPEATLTIVGGKPPHEIQALNRLPNVSVVGFVPDVRPYLASANVAIAPLRIGGGTRLKILEALATGRAVVSTSVGCEGLRVQDGRHLLVADDPSEFADRVIELLRNPQLRAFLGKEGRHLVMEEYDWQALSARMAGALQGLVEQHELIGNHHGTDGKTVRSA